jgi:hypothetical protein
VDLNGVASNINFVNNGVFTPEAIWCLPKGVAGVIPAPILSGYGYLEDIKTPYGTPPSNGVYTNCQ